MENRDFIITSLQPWDIEIGSTIKNTAWEISKKNRVIYINTPMDYYTWMRGNKSDGINKYRTEVVKGQKPYIRKLNENFWVIDCPFIAYSFNFISNNSLFDFLNLKNNKKIAKCILKAIDELRFKNIIHLIDTDIYRSQYLKELIKPDISIYYCRDYVIGQPYWRKHGTRLEPKIAAKADIVLTNSTLFLERFKEYNSNSYAIETGVNLDLYDATREWEEPNDIKPIPRPIIGYIGTLLESRIDVQLLANAARRCPQFSFVLTGPEIDGFEKNELHQIENIYFLGKKEIASLPNYIEAYDVCINPQVLNDITDGNYPLKIDEYLSIGKPCVATSTHTMRDVFSLYTHLFTDTDSFIDCINEALKEVGNMELREARIKFAQTHSWGHSVEKIYSIITPYIKK